MPDLKQFDPYLTDDGPAALVIREHLMPVEGPDGVLFPPTFAAGDGFPGGYNIDGDLNGPNVCLIDTVGSQANRIEPLFMAESYRHLVPQLVVQAGEKSVNLLEAGHRAGDALVRCSSLKEQIDAAFLAVLKGDCVPLARLAPTSLVFGVWNSRGAPGTQAKLPRLVASTIRAFDVRKLTRSAQFNPAFEYINDKLLDEPTDKATKDAYAVRGFIHVPASGTHGGVIATGGVRRDASLGLAALRLLFAGTDKERTLALRRYILGLALTAFTHLPTGFLRQGCLLVLDSSRAKDNDFVEVYPRGERKPTNISHADALAYATLAAEAFGVGASETIPFDKERARRDVKGNPATGNQAKGKVTSVDSGTKQFTIGTGQKKVEIKTTAETGYLKGATASTFGEVIVKGATVQVELANGVAVKVTAK